ALDRRCDSDGELQRARKRQTSLPTESYAQQEQQRVDRIELDLHRDTPERSVDTVVGLLGEIVNGQGVGTEIPGQGDVAAVQRIPRPGEVEDAEREQVGGVDAKKAAIEKAKPSLVAAALMAQVNAE